VLSACKPGADDGEIVLRVLNPTDAPIQGRVTFALPVGSARRLRLDETPVEDAVEVDGESVTFGVGAHALATVGVRWSRAPGRRGGDAASPADRTRRRPA
jgi:alpha-mannosidase